MNKKLILSIVLFFLSYQVLPSEQPSKKAKLESKSTSSMTWEMTPNFIDRMSAGKEGLKRMVLMFLIDESMIQYQVKRLEKGVEDNNYLTVKKAITMLNFYGSRFEEKRHARNYVQDYRSLSGDTFLHGTAFIDTRIPREWRLAHNKMKVQITTELLESGIGINAANNLGTTITKYAPSVPNKTVRKKRAVKKK